MLQCVDRGIEEAEADMHRSMIDEHLTGNCSSIDQQHMIAVQRIWIMTWQQPVHTAAAA